MDLFSARYAHFSAGPIYSSLSEWNATIVAPSETPYENGIFFLRLIMPFDYPFTPPKVTFITKIYHCNIDETGNIRLDILTESGWSPQLSICRILVLIVDLIINPDGNHAFVKEVGELYHSNIDAYNRKAREYVQRYATL